VHFSIAFAVATLLTGSVVIGGAVALIEPACNTVAYYLHEQVWARARTKAQRPHKSGVIAATATIV
jgi:uncharacterized membrane protein